MNDDWAREQWLRQNVNRFNAGPQFVPRNNRDGFPLASPGQGQPDDFRLPPGQAPPLWHQPPANPNYLWQWPPTFPQTPSPSPWGNPHHPFGIELDHDHDSDDGPRPIPWPTPPNRNYWSNAIPTGPWGEPDTPFLRPAAFGAPFPDGGPPPSVRFPSSPPMGPSAAPNWPMIPSTPFPNWPMVPSSTFPPMTPGPGMPGNMFMPMTPAMSSTDMTPVLFAKKSLCDCESLAPRPSNWRPDYAPPRRFQIPTLFRRMGGDRMRINLEHCHLSPILLMPNSRVPVMSFDLRSDNPFDPANLELLTTEGRPFNRTDLTQLATTRPVFRLRFYHPRLPWYLDVRASQPNGILVVDVLQQLHAKLHRAIRPHDFSNTVLDATDRERITDAYRSRCDDRVDIMQQGVRRVDFMGSDVILQGFIEGRAGMWLMKTTQSGRNIDG
ncbi:hypothetical protein MVEN_00781900 [Mycena venus]|uniref:DUF6699 domain-containing protein n=1 Tax=Mycena venus TaxID=2733690 RepID=A0A8H6YKT1_9AGAR|nr:hypothetical protein MVEN_00781900 [Mycena venus]